jgi:hypothetical protein
VKENKDDKFPRVPSDINVLQENKDVMLSAMINEVKSKNLDEAPFVIEPIYFAPKT